MVIISIGNRPKSTAKNKISYFGLTSIGDPPPIYKMIWAVGDCSTEVIETKGRFPIETKTKIRYLIICWS